MLDNSQIHPQNIRFLHISRQPISLKRRKPVTQTQNISHKSAEEYPDELRILSMH